MSLRAALASPNKIEASDLYKLEDLCGSSMHNPILKTLAIATRLTHRLAEPLVGNGQGAPSPSGFGLKHPRHRWTAALAVVVVHAAVPQCGAPQPTASEPDQPPASESAETIPSEPETIAAESAETVAAAPEAVVSALMDAMQVNDAEQIRALFDANAFQAYGDGAARSGEAFFSWLESDIIEREGRVEDAQLTVDGNEVVVTGQYQSRGYTNEANFLLTVENGLITSWRMRY